MRHLYLLTTFAVISLLCLYGFRGGTFRHTPMDVFPDFVFPAMRIQQKVQTEGASTFFADGRADRPPVPGTVPADYGPLAQPFRGDDPALYTGKNPDGTWVRGFPASIKVNMKLLERGRNRFEIYCAPCHGTVGDGTGITKHYGMGATPSYDEDTIRQLANGQIFDTITHGKIPGNMYPYGDKLVPRDRWAVVAYVRALQLAQHASVADVPPDHREALGLK
ncbi:MAG: c-type cytochrome [Opitutaceae bacterium]